MTTKQPVNGALTSAGPAEIGAMVEKDIPILFHAKDTSARIIGGNVADDKAAELARQIATLQHMGIERGLELRVEKIHEMICKHLSAERERCARIVEKAFSGVGGSSIADRIRRGEE